MENDVNVIGKLMKNVFMVTLGTREIQFQKSELANKQHFELSADCKKVHIPGMVDSEIELYQNSAYPEFLCHAKPRLAGKTILDHYDIYKEIVQFPLIESALKNITDNNLIDEVIIVYTDQHDISQEEKKSLDNFNRDTVYYKNILERVLKDNFFKDNILKFSTIAVTEKVTDIDFQYNYFAGKCKLLFAEKQHINQIYLLPQGGIDQINHSLTLQLIQAFGDKVKLWQQAESSESRQLAFANLFLKDLMKRQIISLIDRADYNGAIALAENLPSIPDEQYQTNLFNLKALLKFGKLRMDFLVEDIGTIGRKIFIGMDVPGIIKDYKCKKAICSESYIQCFENSNYFSAFMTSERYYLSRYYFDKKDYSRAVLSLAIFIETFSNHFISANTDYQIIDSNGYRTNGRKLINEKHDLMAYCKQKLSLIDDVKLLSVPINIAICKRLASTNGNDTALQIIRTIRKLNSNFKTDCIYPIDLKRNDIAHRGVGVTDEEVKKIRSSNIIESLDKLIGNLEINPIQKMNSEIIEFINLRF
jgi:hypothetical protein